MRELLHDTFGISNSDISMDNVPHSVEMSNEAAEIFYKSLSDAEKPLYPGCKEFSKLSLLVELFHHKRLGKWTNDSFSKLLKTFNRALPEGEKLPNSYHEVRKVLGKLGLKYKKIHTCPNDCMLYWKEHVKDTECHICEPRLFMSSKTASFMKWHDEGRTKDGCMHHPADSPAWQTFDFQHKEFATDPCNVRLGLASDGFNPFGTMSVAHSTWLVILMPYNLPPWMCMKQPYFMLSLLIPGRSAPGNNMDVYLQPLIDELKELWEAVSRVLHAIKTCSPWLKYSGKHIYMDHRRFLEDNHNHVFRRDKRSFNGKEERRKAPCRLTGSMVQEALKGVEFKFGKLVKDNSELPFNWKKSSIFFELPYWKDNLVRHNLDVMHIEKNICDSVLATLLNYVGKSKDHLKARRDLIEIGIISELHPIEDASGRIYLPAACFSMDKKEKDIFCKVLKFVKAPDGYLADVETTFNRVGRTDDGSCTTVARLPIFAMQGRSFGKVVTKPLDRETLIKAHQYVLFNCEAVDSFSNQHQTMIRDQNLRLCVRETQRLHNEKFASLFGGLSHILPLKGYGSLAPLAKWYRKLPEVVKDVVHEAGFERTRQALSIS
ncbi:hypothetical protein Vadar_015845 [Vaccinium darrowii]|uniref:Uncharacterized protein n=1 Tax=Vaccinium darrowii TaxID=229202 RepID=A0ACB7YE77_9ERIC|nr:hypothetical protein Vadar_015845 [Vaccinium darrowii]